MTPYRRFLAIAALLVLFFLLARGMGRLSLTFDEPSHLAAGYAWLSRGAQGFWTIPLRGHPLLADALSALPLYAGSPDIPVEQLPGWQTERRTFATALIDRVAPLAVSEVAGRVPTALLTVLVGAVVYRWASDLIDAPGESLGGLVALAILVFDPNLLAHGRLATNDVPVMVFGTLALFLVWRWSRHPSFAVAGVAGLAMGAACLAKASGVLWVAGALLFMASDWLNHSRRETHRLWHPLLMGVVTLLVIWAAYGFRVGTLPPLAGLPLPAPLHWESLFFQSGMAEARLAYAVGKLRVGGWWWYFPLAFVLKNPISFVLTSLYGLVYCLRSRRLRRALALPAVFSFVYVVVAIAKGPNIGYRHLLPLHPGLYLAMAVSLVDAMRRETPGTRRFGRTLVAVLYGWYLIGTVVAWPNELAYFNEIAGPKTNRHNWLISSNLDWGQMMHDVEQYLLEHRTETTYVAYEHTAPYPLTADYHLPPSPEAEDISSPFHPPPGLYLIGATNLHIPTSCCDFGLDSYAYFRSADPVDTIGGAILVYRVTSQSTPRWLVQCGGYDAPLTDEVVSRGLSNTSDLRRIDINCTQVWLYPAGGEVPGIYALPVLPGYKAGGAQFHFLQTDTVAPIAEAHAGEHDAAFVRGRLAPTRPSYRQPAGFIPPPFVLFEMTQAPIPPKDAPLYPAPAGAKPAALQLTKPSPISFVGSFELLDVAVSVPGAAEGCAEAATWWRVTGPPPNQPFSIMAHLVSEGGETIAVADALDLNPVILQEGDIFVQRHVFSVPNDTKTSSRSIWMRVGLYGLEDLARWSVAGTPGADAVFAPVDRP